MVPDFSYTSPGSIEELLGLLSKCRATARILAGGTDLIVQMRSGARAPECVIDIKRIPELNALSWSGDGLGIGASVTCRTLNEDAEVTAAYPALVDATSCIGGIQIQGRATVGGNLCNASPSADSVPALIVLRATLKIRNPGESRFVPVEHFCSGPGETVLGDDELLERIELPLPAANSGAKFIRFTPRNEMDIAVASAAAAVTLDDDGRRFAAARIAIGAVAPVPLLVESAGAMLAGQAIGDEAIAEAARIARDAARPIDDMRGSAIQRRQLVEVLVRRALTGAVQRAGSTAA